MRVLITLLVLVCTFQVKAAFDEDCKIRVKELKPFVDSSEMILFSQMQSAYEDATEACEQVYARLGDQKSFKARLKKIENNCERSYGKKNYEEKFFDLLQCKVTSLYNSEG